MKKLVTTIENSVVYPVQFGYVNVYFIKTRKGYILVDAGMPSKTKKLDDVFTLTGIVPQSVHLIIITHGHVDHVGLLAYAKATTGAEVLSHESLAKKLAAGESESPVAQNWVGQFLAFMMGILKLTGGANINGVSPDILVRDSFDLDNYGVSGKVIHTPGHSFGSISIVLDNGETLVGDMLRNEGKGNIGPGMFYEDKRILLESLEAVVSFESRKIYLSHDGSIDNNTLRNAIAAIKTTWE